MRFDLMSDVHLNFFRGMGGNAEHSIRCLFDGQYRKGRPETLVIAGDIAEMEGSDEFVEIFFDEARRLYRNVVYVLGNHDYWGGLIGSACEKWAAKTGIAPLDGTSVEIDGVTVVGGTLWTHVPPQEISVATASINDFRFIKAGPWKRLTVGQLNDIHDRTFDAIKSAVEAAGASGKRVMVVTHHAPLLACGTRGRHGVHLMSSYCNDCSGFIQSHPCITAWCHGHCHDAKPMDFGKFRILANPYGYFLYETFYLGWRLRTFEI